MENDKKITKNNALKILMEGNSRFVANTALNRNLKHKREETAGKQDPFAAILSCMDSRVSSEIIFDQGIGDIFNIRVAGNFVDKEKDENQDILGGLEFAVLNNVELILVLGHTNCGAVKAAVDNSEFKEKSLHNMIQRLKTNIVPNDDKKSPIEINVLNTIKHIQQHSIFVKKSNIKIVGGIHHLETGVVEII